MQDGSQEPQRGAIVPGGPAMRTVRPQASHGALMLVLGCVVALFLPYAGVLLSAYGMRELAEASGVRGMVVALALSAALLAVGSFVDASLVVFMGPALVCSLAVVGCMWRGATVTNVSAAVVLGAAAALGLDAAIAAFAGISVRDTIVSSLMAGVQSSVGTGVEADLLVRQVEPLVVAVWPFTYVTGSAVNALVAGVGSHLMAVRSKDAHRPGSISRFDAPMWSIAVLAISTVCLGASFTGFPEAEALRTISVTALLSVRIIFACQGFGVASALMSSAHMGCLTRTICTFFLFWIEMVFFIVSIVGLVDVWANFRRLARSGPDAQEQH